MRCDSQRTRSLSSDIDEPPSRSQPKLPFSVPDVISKHLILVKDPADIAVEVQHARKRRLHALIQRYISQIQYGCKEPLCTTPTCLSFRRRTANSPVRRYTELSARTLACFLVEENNPEASLCPHEPVVPSEKHSTDKPQTRRRAEPKGYENEASRMNGTVKQRQANGHARAPITRLPSLDTSVKPKSSAETPTSHRSRRPSPRGGHETSEKSSQAEIHEKHPVVSSVHYKPQNDTKSFSQSLFDTLPLRRFQEWMPSRSKPSLHGGARNLEQTPPVQQEECTVRQMRKSKSFGLDQLDSATEFRDSETPTDLTSQSNGHVVSLSSRPTRTDSGDPMKRVRCGSISQNIVKPLRRSSKDELGRLPPGKPPTLKMNGHIRADLTSTLQPLVRESSDRSWSPPLSVGSGLPSSPGRSAHDQAAERANRLESSDRENTSTLDEDIDRTSESEDTDAMVAPSCAVSSLGFLSSEILQNFYVLHKESPPSSSNGPDVAALIRQSLFYCMKDPARLLECFGRIKAEPATLHDLSVPKGSHINLHLLESSFSLVYDMRPPSEIVSNLAMALHALLIPATVVKTDWRSASSSPEKRDPAFTSDNRSSSAHSIETTACRRIDDTQAALICVICLSALSAIVVREGLNLSDAKTFRRARADGKIMSSLPEGDLPEAHQGNLNTVETAEQNKILQRRVWGLTTFGDVFDDPFALNAFEKIVSVIGNRLIQWEVSKTRTTKVKKDGKALQKKMNILQEIVAHLESTATVSTQSNTQVVDLARNFLHWLHTLMLRDWDGKPVVRRAGTVGSIVQILAAMYKAHLNMKLEPREFWMPFLAKRLNLMEMPVDWLSYRPDNKTLHLLSYSFLFEPDDVVKYFRVINYTTMMRAREKSLSVNRDAARFGRNEDPPIANVQGVFQLLAPSMALLLVIEVGRTDVLKDAINQIWRRQRKELMRPLKVRLGMDEGEEGVDHGGVQQEFFRVLFAEALNPDFGMFTVDERTHMTWFQPMSLEPLDKFEALGILMSIAVYNSITLPVTFPLAFYRKLLGLKVKKLEHIKDGWPELSSGLQSMLDWEDGDVGDVFMRTYEFSFDVFGKEVSVDMERAAKDPKWPAVHEKKGKQQLEWPTSSLLRDPADEGSSSASLVTNTNRDAYVRSYIHFLADRSIAPQFAAFQRGFLACLNPTALSIFTPEALQHVVEGSTTINVNELEKIATYEDGYEKNSQPVKWFWEVLREWGDDASGQARKQALLEFVTSCGRVPVGGLAKVAFVVQRVAARVRRDAGDADQEEEEGRQERLPTSMTCFGRLLLPEYTSKAVLRKKLERAIENSAGFGVA